ARLEEIGRGPYCHSRHNLLLPGPGMTASWVRTNRHVSDKADRHDGSGLRLRLSETASRQPLEKGVKAQFSLVRLGKLSYFPAARVMVLGGPIAPAVLRTQGGC